jgi:transcription elongation factor Elf1
MGSVAGSQTFVCDACSHEYPGTHADLSKLGWKRHPLKRGKGFLMCKECEQRFEPLWKEK